MGIKKKRVYINLVGNSSIGKAGKSKKGGSKSRPGVAPGAPVSKPGGKPGGKP